MAAKIFINYRRSDSESDARSIALHLQRIFGESNVFFDNSRFRPGDSFPKLLRDAAATCKVMLCIIGPGWLTASSDDGKRRIDDPTDWVRLEIECALAQGSRVTVVPVVVGGATLPRPSDVPESLRPLLERNAVFVSAAVFRHVIEGLERDLRPLVSNRRKFGVVGAVGVALLALGFGIGAYRMMSTQPTSARWTGSKCMEVSISGAQSRCIVPGSGESVWFKDCSDCPEMVVVPAISFTMGSPEDEPERPTVGETQIAIRIERPFAVGRYAVTRAEFEAFVRTTKHETQGGCHATTSFGWEQRADLNWKSPGFPQDDFHPVVCLNWNDANAYVQWLKETTNKGYRLLSETEREFVARTALPTPFWWGSTISTEQANYNGNYAYNHGPTGENRKGTVRVDSFISNPWGLYNVHGNVWEWTADCWNESNIGNPGTGEPRETGECNLRIVRGGSWFSKPSALRAAFRFKDEISDRSVNGGFRVARDLSP